MKLFAVLLLIVILNSATAQYQNTYLNIPYDSIEGVPTNLLSLDIHRQVTGENLPVVFFIHGGGWSTGGKAKRTHDNKRDFFVNNGFIFVSINYRLSPEIVFPQHSIDVAKAYSYVIENITYYGGDSNQMFLMGHSAGAHLAALLATDKSYLNDFEFGLSDIKAVILLDGAGYNIPWVIDDNMQNNNQSGLDMYHTAFGYDEETWEQASPITHINDEDVTPPFMMFHVSVRRLSTVMASQMRDKFIQHNQMAETIAVENSSHYLINNDFGQEGDLVSQLTLDFIVETQLQIVQIFTNSFE